MKFEVFLKDEYIIRAGEKGDRMFFIMTGVVDVLMDGKVATSLSDGSHFGEICLLTDDRRVATVKAATVCDLFSLSKRNFEAILEEYPDMRCALETVALRRLSKIGKKPAPEEIKTGRLSTTIPPPHISMNTPEGNATKKGTKSASPVLRMAESGKSSSVVESPLLEEVDLPVEERGSSHVSFSSLPSITPVTTTVELYTQKVDEVELSSACEKYIRDPNSAVDHQSQDDHSESESESTL